MRTLLTVLVLLIGLLMLGCERSISMATLDQTAADIFDGKIVVDKNGSCTIDAKNNVIDNVAYVTIHLDGSKLILLRTWQGKGSNIRGILYTNGPPLTVGSEIEVSLSNRLDRQVACRLGVLMFQSIPQSQRRVTVFLTHVTKTQ